LGDAVTPGTTTYYSIFARTGCGEYSVPDSESQISVFMPVSGIDDNPKLPDKIGLFTSYPNPFNASTVLSYNLPEAGNVEISIYNLVGQRAAILCDNRQDAGRHRIIWDGGSCPSGIYFAKLRTGNKQSTIKLILIK
jgi:hypothetical protein